MKFSAFVAATLAFPISAGAQEFIPNHLFVVNRNTNQIIELDASASSAGADTTVVRTFGSAVELSGPESAVFAPNGHLYVSSVGTDRVVEYDADGTVVNQLGSDSTLDAPHGLAVAANGNIYVCSGNTGSVMEFALGDGSFVQEIGATAGMLDPSGIALSPDGHIFVSSPTQSLIYEFVPKILTNAVRTYNVANHLNQPTGLTFGIRGHLFITNKGDDKVIEADELMNFVTDFGNALVSVPSQVSFGPDGEIYVTSEALDRVVIFNGDESPDVGQDLIVIGPIGLGLGLDAPSGLAWSPFRFGAQLTGKATRFNAAKVSLTEKFKKKSGIGPILTLAPGDRRVYLTLTDGTSTTDWATLLHSNVYAFSGYEVRQDLPSTKWAFGGLMIQQPNFETGQAAVELDVKGKFDARGRYVVKSMKGPIFRQLRNIVMHGTLKTSKQIKPTPVP